MFHRISGVVFGENHIIEAGRARLQAAADPFSAKTFKFYGTFSDSPLSEAGICGIKEKVTIEVADATKLREPAG